MDFENKSITNDDCLKITRIFCCDILHWGITKIFLKILLVMHSLVIVVHVYYFLFKLSIGEIIKFLPLFCFTICGVMVIFVHIIFGPLAEKKPTYKLWCKNSASDKIKKQIEFESRMTNGFTIFYTIWIILTVFFISYKKDIELQLCLITFLSENNSSWILKIFSTFYLDTIVFFVYFLVITTYEFIYSVQHIRFQLRLLNEHLDKLNFGYEDDIDLFISHTNQKYQDDIKERLRFCIERYQELKGAALILNRKIDPFFLVLIIGGNLCGISCLIYLHSAIMKHNTPLYPAVMLTISFISPFYSTIIAGQLIENEFEQSHILIFRNKFYLWNMDNQRTFLIFLPYIQRPYEVKLIGSIICNYNLGIAIVKFMFSVISVYIQIQKRF